MTETLTCRAGHPWKRKVKRGPKPAACPVHWRREMRSTQERIAPAQTLRNAHWAEYRALFRHHKARGGHKDSWRRQADRDLRRRYPSEYLRAWASMPSIRQL